MRQPLAMKRLEKEVRRDVEDVTVTYGEPDGFGVNRAITFDPFTSDAIAEAVETIAKVDRRIAAVEWAEDQLVVRFTTTVWAEDKNAFSLSRVRKTLLPPADEEPQPTEREVRTSDLQSMSRAELDAEYPEYADAKNKAHLIASVLADEDL